MAGERTPFDRTRRVNIYVPDPADKLAFDLAARKSGRARGEYLAAIVDLHAKLVERAGDGSRVAIEILRDAGLE